MTSYLRPERLEEALAALRDGRHVVVAGATDHYPSRVGRSVDEDVLDITGLAGLGPIRQEEGGWWIPATATWCDLIAADLPPLFDGLRAAARTIGGVQIQNRGTVCGNVANASPAADGIPNLMALDASLELASLDGRRRLPVGHFVTGNRQTLRRPEELVTGIHIPAPEAESRSGFLKLGSRAALVISVVMVAGVVGIRPDGRIGSARFAVGACSPVACLLPEVAARLRGRPTGSGLSDRIGPEALAPLSPIDDIRGTAAYRRDAALTLVRRLVEELCR
ncbi:xanthine dehydrogenase family protein subunit M [soil metagenome]